MISIFDLQRPRVCSALAASALCGFLLAPAPASAEPSNACAAPADLNRLAQPLARVAGKLATGQPVTIVAIGSSSTAGAGASSSAACYPSKLEVELKERFPSATIRVLNRGVNGETAREMIARFDKSVFAEQPDLVLWQVGTNSVLRDESLDAAGSMIRSGLTQLKASGADVILIDPQFAPKVVDKPEAPGMVRLIGTAAHAVNVSVFNRFSVMRHWHQAERLPFESFLSPDGLHMNDWSYACFAKLLAGAIAEAATRTSTIARVPAGAGTSAAVKP